MIEGDEPQGELLDAVESAVRERFDDDDTDTMARLVRAYYAHASLHELRGRPADDLCNAAMAHLDLARHRSADHMLLRIYSPTIADDGWQSPHTVIDLVIEDSPFIVASTLMAIERVGLDVHLLIHPVLTVRRNQDGRLVGPRDDESIEVEQEAFVHIEVDRTVDPDRLAQIETELSTAMSAVRKAIDDWPSMVHRASGIARDLNARHLDPDASGDTGQRTGEAADAVELLRWMAGGEFIFLGARDYELDPVEGIIRSVADTGLGLLSDSPPSTRSLSELPPEGAARVLSDDILLITKTNARSLVHRADPMDYIGIRHHDPETGLITEHRFIGLFTSRAYSETVTRLPVIAPKVARIVERAGFSPGSHDANRLINVLEEHPRDELFHASVDELVPTIMAIVHLYERRSVRLFVRRDSFGRSVSCLVFVPRDRFRTEVRETIQDILESAFGGTTADFEVSLSSSPLARLYVIVSTTNSSDPLPDLDAVERRLERITRTWSDELELELIDHAGEARGTELAARWRHAFPAGYREDRAAGLAIADIERLEALAEAEAGTLAIRSYHPPGADDGTLNVKLYRYGGPVQLSTILPFLHAHGVAVLDERPYQLNRADGRNAWIHDFGLRLPRSAAENIRQHGDSIRRRFEDSLNAAWLGRTESDHFAELVLSAGMTWREVSVIRAFAHYLRQAGATFSPTYIQEVTTAHAGLTRLLIDRFHHRLDPDRLDPEADTELNQWVLDALDAVPRLDEDRILRGLNALVDATVRTNLYQRDSAGRGADHLVLKFDPTAIPDLPKPRPAHEIFVSSPRVEGVHLRAGRVARGGIRWSDRKEDYRTEVLALMKAQVVKNAVIVPVGAKGGFICRQLPPDDDRAGVRAEVEACYRIFVGAMLDVTDNLVDGAVVAPDRVVRRDGDDPYLVVAADRGTATFSDVANSIAIERGFWLGDAFASGGSNGYDHKEMGITARGAWVSVRRHMAELEIDPETDPITVTGIGDMSGDVFGNGMLLSRQIHLVAAFDHRHVFVDPTPDAERSYAERQRLFSLPSSTWADFDRDVLSPGGFIVSRTAKAVTIDDRVAHALGCSPGQMTPNSLISCILRAPVDLLWNGGLGTYVKASTETHEEVGDRANDAVRIDADELRCKVVGEGGNLGFTQRGRVQAALGSVRINTDSVDNSGGVNSSDREVNLKILLDQVVKSGRLTVEQRNELLQEMTEEVAQRVLADNAAQALALSSARTYAAGMTHVHARHLAWLERHGDLDRAIEALPTDEELAERANDGVGMTQPELAVVMAYTKNVITEQLVDSSLPDDPAVAAELDAYVPDQVRVPFPDAVESHPLRRELLATQLANRMVNRAGVSMTLRLSEETAATVPEIARAHIAAWRMLDLDQQWQQIEVLEAHVPPSVVVTMLLSTKGLGERATRWLIRNRRSPIDIAESVGELGGAVGEVVAVLPEVVSGAANEALIEDRARWIAAGVPTDLAVQVSLNPLASTALDIVSAARAQGATLDMAARVYFLVDDQLGLGWLRRQIDLLPRNNMWSTLARTALRDDLFHEHASIVGRILGSGGHDSAETRVDRWITANQEPIDRAFDLLLSIRSANQPGLEHLSVGLREIRNLMRRASAAPVASEGG